jgi:hypothetical protein
MSFDGNRSSAFVIFKATQLDNQLISEHVKFFILIASDVLGA